MYIYIANRLSITYICGAVCVYIEDSEREREEAGHNANSICVAAHDWRDVFMICASSPVAPSKIVYLEFVS